MAAEEPGAGRRDAESHPVSAARATTGPSYVSQEAKQEPAATEGEGEEGEVEAGDRAEEEGSTQLAALDGIGEQSQRSRYAQAAYGGPLTHPLASLAIRLAT